MRELLRLVLDRLNEVCVLDGVYFDEHYARENIEVRKLKHQIAVVLSKGLYDGTLTDVDMRQLPPAL